MRNIGAKWLIVLAVMGGLACGPAGAPAVGGESSAGQAAAPEDLRTAKTAFKNPAGPAKRGGVMTIPPSESPQTVDPYFSAAGASMGHVARPVVQTLVDLYQPTPDYDFSASNRVEPVLAERWEMPDDKTVIFHIRKGVKFHNGDDLDADDVLFSFEYARDPKNKFQAATSYRNVDKIEKLDQYTVRLTVKEIDPDVLNKLSGANAYILSKAFFDQGGDPKREMVGTGPFRVSKFDHGSEAILIRNDGYWDKGKPYLDAIRLVYGLERSAILAAFATKKIDHMNLTDKVQFDDYRRQVPDLKFYLYNSTLQYGWYPNVSRPPLNDVRVRRAMQLAIDRHALNEAVAFGLGRISAPGDAGFLGEAGLSAEQLFKMPGWRQPKDADLEEARRLMREAGYPNGFVVRGLFNNTFTTVPQQAELMAVQLKNALSIEVKLVGLDSPLWADAVHSKGDFDLAMGNSRVPAQPDTNLTNYWYSKGSFNKAGINDPKLDALILRQKSIMNETERSKVWAEISRLITEEGYYISGLDGAYFGVVQPWVNNLHGNFAPQPWLRKPAEVWFDVSKMPADRVKADNDILAKYK